LRCVLQELESATKEEFDNFGGRGMG
jgi:hypothetical protein